VPPNQRQANPGGESNVEPAESLATRARSRKGKQNFTPPTASSLLNCMPDAFQTICPACNTTGCLLQHLQISTRAVQTLPAARWQHTRVGSQFDSCDEQSILSCESSACRRERACAHTHFEFTTQRNSPPRASAQVMNTSCSQWHPFWD
jgi:hypothetical protein